MQSFWKNIREPIEENDRWATWGTIENAEDYSTTYSR